VSTNRSAASLSRLLTALLLVAATGVMASAARRPAETTLATDEAVSRIPYTLGEWRGQDAAPLDAEELTAIAADRIVNRTYATPQGDATGLYVAYYAQQRPGVSIHSPLHCLPGTGWAVLTNDVRPLDADNGGGAGDNNDNNDNRANGDASPARGSVRRLVAEKEGSKILVLYWYDIQGRMITSDIMSRFQLVSNRIRLGRNDASLVRLVLPITDSESAAEARGLAFARALLPHL
jgi:hypothetical protein